MVAVITGDIINSRAIKTALWQNELKAVLSNYGNAPGQWEIYRGDSFQLKVEKEKAVQAAIHIKACMKKLNPLDVRMAIGIGEEDFKGKGVTESTGSAYIRSGNCYEQLKKQNLAIKSGDSTFDECFNLLISLALLTMDNWTALVAGVVQATIEHPEKNQKELAEMLGKTQSSISEALKRAGAPEINQFIEYYHQKAQKL